MLPQYVYYSKAGDSEASSYSILLIIIGVLFCFFMSKGGFPLVLFMAGTGTGTGKLSRGHAC